MPAKIEHLIYKDSFKLHVYRRWGSNVDIIQGDGTWVTVGEMQVAPENSGIEFPMYLLDEIFEAFMQYKGLKTHDPTEVKVLREWLTVEKARVEDMIQKFLR